MTFFAVRSEILHALMVEWPDRFDKCKTGLELDALLQEFGKVKGYQVKDYGKKILEKKGVVG